MDEIIFLTVTRDGKHIRLTKTQWNHISYRHPEMTHNLDDIRKTVENPTTIKSQSENIKRLYYYLKEENKYIMVAIKILNGTGFVITSYKTKRI